MIRLPAAEDPEVSLIVLLDGSAAMAERCLRAIAASEESVPCETVVLLNDPDPELEALVRGGTGGGRVVLCRANAGPGVGWNLGSAVARAPRLATLHEDTEPSPGWLAPLCETMTESGAGAVGARLFNRDGSVQNCGWVLFADASHQTLREETAPELVAATEPTPADMVSGAAMLVDREAVRAAGGWDERFHPAVFVDIDVSTAIWNQGRLVLSVPASEVVHESGAFDRRPSAALTGPALRLFLFERNRHPFLAKWEGAARDLAPPAADADPEIVRAAVAEALPRTRRRAEAIRQGEWRASGRRPQAERRFTALAEPVLADGDGYTVAAEVVTALRGAEADLVAEYCRWLAAREQELDRRLRDTHAALLHRVGDVDALHGHIEALRRDNERLSAELNRTVGARARRLRGRVRRALGRT